MSIISNIEKFFHLIIYLMVLLLCGEEVRNMIVLNSLQVENVLMFFIYLEIMQMVSIFFSSGKIPIRYPLYISMFSLARHISFDNLAGIEALYLSGSIALIAGALVGLGYRDKLLNHKEPEFKED